VKGRGVPSGVRWGSERCENAAWGKARLGAPGLGGWEQRLFQHPARGAVYGHGQRL